MRKEKNRNRDWQRKTGRALRASLAVLLALLLTGAPGALARAEEGETVPEPAPVQGHQPVNIVVTPDGEQPPAEQPAANPEPAPVPAEQPASNGGSGSEPDSDAGNNGDAGSSGGSGSGSTNTNTNTYTAPPSSTKAPLQLSSWVSLAYDAWEVAYGTPLEDAGLPISLRARSTAGDTIRVPVRWRSDVAYDPTVPGIYLFTARAREAEGSTYWAQLLNNLPKAQRVITVMPSGEAVAVPQTQGEDPVREENQPAQPAEPDNAGGWVPDPNAGWSNEPGIPQVINGDGGDPAQPNGQDGGEGGVYDAAGNLVNPVPMTPVNPDAASEPAYMPGDATADGAGDGEADGDPLEEEEAGEALDEEIDEETGEEIEDEPTEEPTGEEGMDAGATEEPAGDYWVYGVEELPPARQYQVVAPGTALSDLDLPETLNVMRALKDGTSGEEDAVPHAAQVTWSASPAYDAQAWVDYMAARTEIEAQAAAQAEALPQPQVVTVGPAQDGALAAAQQAAQQAAAQQAADKQAALNQALEALAMPPTSYTFTPAFTGTYAAVDGQALPAIYVNIDAPSNLALNLADTATGELFSLRAVQGAIVKDASGNEYQVIDFSTSPQRVIATKVVTSGALSIPFTFTAVTPDTLQYVVTAVRSGAFSGSSISTLTLGSGISSIQSGAFPAGTVSTVSCVLTDVSFISTGAFPTGASVNCPASMVYAYRRLGFSGAIAATGPYDVVLGGAANAEIGVPYTVTVTFGCAYDSALTPATLPLTVSGGTVSSVSFTPYSYLIEGASLGPMTRTATVTVIPNAAGTMTISLGANTITPAFFGVQNNAAGPITATVTAASAHLNTLTATPAVLPYGGGNSTITLDGYNLNLLTSLDLRGYGATPIPLALASPELASAILTFPANTSHAAQVYTLQLFANGADTGKRVTVTVAPNAWVDYIKANKTRLYRGGGTVKVTIYGEHLDYFSSLVITTNDRHPVDATIVRGSGGTKATASIKIGKNTTKGSLYYDLRLWVDGVATDHVVEVKQYNYYNDPTPTSTPAPSAALDYQKVYLDDQLGNQRAEYDLTKAQMDQNGAMQIQVPSSTASHSYLVSARELTDLMGRDATGLGYLQLNTGSYGLRIPYRVLMQPVTNPNGTVTEELLPNITDYLVQNNLQTNNLWLRVGLTPMVGGGYQVVLSLEYQLRPSTTNAATQPLTTSVPVVLMNLAHPLEINSAAMPQWVPIAMNGIYLQPYGTTGSGAGEKG